MEPRRWTFSAVFAWRPILTYARRRNNALEWFENNLDLEAFFNDGPTAGIAVGSPNKRLVISPSGMTLADSTGEGIEGLQPAINAVFDLLAPDQVHLVQTASRWSRASSFDDYAWARHNAAMNAVGELPGFVCDDVAILTDLTTPGAKIQVECGFVNDIELSDRLTDPHIGRISDENVTASIGGEPLPAVSAYAFATLRPSSLEFVTDADSTYQIVDESDGLLRSAIAGLFDSIERSYTEKGHNNE